MPNEMNVMIPKAKGLPWPRYELQQGRIATLEAALREAINIVELHFCDEKEHGQPCMICEDALPLFRHALTQTEETFDSVPLKTDGPNYTCNYQRATQTEETP